MLKPVLITALIVDRPTCLACTAQLADCTAAEVLETLEALKPMLATRMEVERCRQCGKRDTLYSLGRPDVAQGAQPEKRP
jgi:hypothetical protein